MTTERRDTDISASRAGAREVGLGFPVSRRTDPVSIVPGARVIVRRLLPAEEREGSSGPTVTDVIGELLSIDPLRVRPQARAKAVGNTGVITPAHPSTYNGEDDAGITIPHEDVVVLKTLSARPVRNRDIRAVEEATAAAFPGLHNQWFGGWLARAGDGITERSNSAVPLAPEASTQPVPLAAIQRFYAEHHLPTRLLIPDRIGRPAQGVASADVGPEIVVMTRDLTDLPPLPEGMDARLGPGGTPSSHGLQVQIDPAPEEQWLSMYHFRGQPLPRHALRLLSQRIEGHLGFGRVLLDGQLAAITRGTVTHGGGRQWLGYSAVEVAPSYRRQGLGTLLGIAMLHWGRREGASGAYLQVVQSNTPGRALYQRLGFSEHHRHRCITVASTDNHRE
ncbi:N-acetylglutamate synthase, CG3035 family [Corynebacterium heidelbergense]|uniref:GNAT family N-acetyltransferase n=1 Tax=Corynebacterium heidelbergense TaxID=2055947 RepID=A0A364VC30_9CORY|nr:GNAT family N-acetyltransferase [Corynebacterium heidelbergense]RAV34184.1 GNAT family N-acetyltransferase [Corynebacterium heidelbergense]WCZ35854.1 Mycothiol acetyltransferase [Corynebacterium heidelbergense]